MLLAQRPSLRFYSECINGTFLNECEINFIDEYMFQIKKYILTFWLYQKFTRQFHVTSLTNILFFIRWKI